MPSRSLTKGYMNNCIVMPMEPKIAMAKPTLRGGRPSPPVKVNGG